MDNYLNGVLVERWDDAARLYTDFTTEPDTVLTYAEKSASDGFPSTYYDDLADLAAAEATLDANKRTIEESLDLRMDVIQAILDDTNANINTNPAQRIKDVSRAIRLLIRLVRDNYNGTM